MLRLDDDDMDGSLSLSPSLSLFLSLTSLLSSAASEQLGNKKTSKPICSIRHFRILNNSPDLIVFVCVCVRLRRKSRREKKKKALL